MENFLVDEIFLNNGLTDIANATRSRCNVTKNLSFPNDIIEEIDNLDTGIIPEGNIIISDSGITDVTEYATASIPSGESVITVSNDKNVLKGSFTPISSGWFKNSDFQTAQLQLPVKEAITIIPSMLPQIAISADTYTLGNITLKGDNNLIPKNIKQGISIFGVNGVCKGKDLTYAFIQVTYSSGAICTCSDGTTTLTASNTSGAWSFPVPNSGTWTVSSVKDNITKTETVTISQKGEIKEVTLIHPLYLCQNGVFDTSITRWSAKAMGYSSQYPTASSSAIPTITKKSGYTEFKTDDVWHAGVYYTTSAINFSGYTKLKIECSYTLTASEEPSFQVVIRNTTSGYIQDFSNSIAGTTYHTVNLSDANKHIESVDVSNLGTKYIFLVGETVTAKIYNIWLE